MVKLCCLDYGFKCNFVVEGDDSSEVIETYGKHSNDEHGIDYSKEALTLFIERKYFGK